MIYNLLALGGFIFIFYNTYTKLYAKLGTTQSSIPFKNITECNTPIQIAAESGSVPSWLHGILYRIGPGTFNIKKKDNTDFVIRHAFDGLPFVHRFELNAKTQMLTYNSRMTAKSMEKAIKNNTLRGQIYFGYIEPFVSLSTWLAQAIARVSIVLFSKWGRLPDGDSFGVTTTPNFPVPNNIEKGRVLVSKTEANKLQKLNADTLGNIDEQKAIQLLVLNSFFILEPEADFAYSSFDSRFSGCLSAAHHQWDPRTEEIFNFTMSMIPFPRLALFSTSIDGKATLLADITHRKDGTRIRPAYIHSFWLTENYVILPEVSLYHNQYLDLLFLGSMTSSLKWDKQQPSYLHIVHRDGRGLAASIPVQGFFTFHTLNAFEKDNKIYLDLAEYSNGDIVYQVQTYMQPYVEKPAASPFELNGVEYPLKTLNKWGDLVRYCVDLKSQTARKQMVTTNIEFPRFNHAKTFEPYRFVYGCHLNVDRNDTGSLIKVDMNNGSIKEFLVEGFNCSEPVFVPNPKVTEEDGGVLLCLMNSPDCCYLVVLDAVEMIELARYKIGQFSAITFHGSYVDHEFKTISPN